MSGQLAEAVRTVIATLRSLANTLESALARAEATASPLPVVDLESAHSWELPASIAPEPAAAPFLTPRHGSVPAITTSSPARTAYSTNSYHEVADSLPPLPGYCLDWCIRLGGSKEEITSRATRAWTAGCWARAAFDGRFPKPRPTPQLALRATVYIILKAPGISRPVRVGTAAEYFRLLPSFKEGSSDSNSISHSFPSLAEGKVYCAAFGIDLPEQPEHSGEGLPHAVCHAPSCRRPTCSRASRGVCGASHGERRRNAFGFAGGFHSGGVDSARDGGCRGFPFWAFNRDLGAGDGRGRCRTRGSLRDKHQLSVDGFQLGGSSWTSRIRPCDRRRWDPVFLAKAIFPLPVPSPGVFCFEGGHPSSRRRHKRCREQAFHVVVMALNFLHADCQFVNLKLLARPPNLVQEETLNNLRRIFLAFRHAAGEISVPASGRRCTSLVSLLADLSEFLTKEGIADSAYQRGFPEKTSNGSVPSNGFRRRRRR